VNGACKHTLMAPNREGNCTFPSRLGEYVARLQDQCASAPCSRHSSARMPSIDARWQMSPFSTSCPVAGRDYVSPCPSSSPECWRVALVMFWATGRRSHPCVEPPGTVDPTGGGGGGGDR
jgi:hypothetical protein